MNALLAAILVSAIIAFGFQMVVPFPFGLIFGVGIAVIIIWYTRKTKSVNQFSLFTYKRVDPRNEDEEKQNREAYRILKKRFLDGEITKEEFDRLREPFGDME
ncbi:hypothetical protein [Candidatus Nitrosotenuis sp. DW1]|uniref:hypothetical protein n=1 Tax=Candidatus Nitrosotenuis sp. DW1 TaxID=2259672 RepID=UPI0015C76FE3|nr:hypothetical protein [Candidatus Nitrosotenuis sp. DW1]QLH08754.1 hypothetical protein DSQ19_04000 [Candidatus Nitrosotenuis sp. DW1]